MSSPKIIVNALMTPKGNIIMSHHRHDYVEADGCFIDGGGDYVRWGGNGTLITLTEEDPFEVLRYFMVRGGRGKNGDEPLKYVPLFKINDNWLDALIEYEQDRRPDNFWLPYYIKEKEFRQGKGIKIEE